MASEWKVVPLSTLAKVQSGFAFKSADMGESGYPIIKIKNIIPPDVDITVVQRVLPSNIVRNKQIEKFKLSRGDILIAMTGATVGKVGRMPQSSETHYLNQRVGKVFLIDDNAADYDYVYYVLSQSGHVAQMLGLADGSAQPNISGAQIESLEIPFPPLPEQKAIAHVLGSIDDKIELNRKMNETLEAMAQALFKSWFVDFDPVIDNALVAGNPIPEEFATRAETRRKALANGTANRKIAKASLPPSKKPTSSATSPMGGKCSQ
jgi:type I restriction enzyme, S subunit